MENKILKNILLIIFTALFLTVTGYIYRGFALSTPFVDEQDNFAAGNYLLKGEILYEDIITNHQPAIYILSSVAEKIKNSNTTFSLLLNQRTAIIFWAIIWSLILASNFGIVGFLFVIIFELTKSQMFGNLFLAESVVVYPLVFLIGILLFDNKILKSKIKLFLLGLSLAFSFLTLSPLWPLLVIFMFMIIARLKNELKEKGFYIFLGVVIVILVVFKFSSIQGYIDSIYLNLAYTVPAFHEPSYQSWIITISKSFATPVFSFFSKDNTAITGIIRILTILLSLNLISFLHRRNYVKAFLVIILLGLANIRFTYPGTGSYNGFHLLPWYGIFIFMAIATSKETLKSTSNKIIRIILLLSIVSAVFLSLVYGKSFFLEKKDPQKEYTTNYSTHTDTGQIIKIMKEENDTLFVSPDAWLIYWQSDVNHLPKLYGYYAWMSGIPEIHKKILENFEKNPPTFFYCEDCKELDLEKFLAKYKQVIKNDGKTHLYVLPQRMDNLSEAQKNELKFYGVN